jgi:hypothetical protein
VSSEPSVIRLYDAPPGIEHQDDEGFLGGIVPVRAGNVGPPIVCCFIRGLHCLNWDGALAHPQHFELMGWFHLDKGKPGHEASLHSRPGMGYGGFNN